MVDGSNYMVHVTLKLQAPSDAETLSKESAAATVTENSPPADAHDARDAGLWPTASPNGPVPSG